MNFWLKLRSLPSRERGLKQFCGYCSWHAAQVAPFAGAWIETIGPWTTAYARAVAPYAGAWIETMSCTEKGWTKWGAPYLGAKTGTE